MTKIIDTITDFFVSKSDQQSIADTIFNNSFDVIIVVDAYSVVQLWNPSAEILLGWSKEEAIGKHITDLFVPKRFNSRYSTELKKYLKTGKSEKIGRKLIRPIRTKDGIEINVSIAINPVKRYNHISHFVITIEDLSIQQCAENDKIKYVQELNARITTVMSILQAIVKQSLVTADPEEIGSLLARLFAIDKALKAMFQNNWSKANLYSLIYDISYLYGPHTKFLIKGDTNFNLQGNTAISFALIIHELCTNAVKYGALKKENKGRIIIDWHLHNNSLVWSWREIDGPKVIVPDEIGFGIQFIKRAFTGQGTTIIEYPESGLTCTIVLKFNNMES